MPPDRVVETAYSKYFKIHIYPDKVLIYNDGKLPENWTVEDLLASHTSVPHNPLIAGTFFRSGLIEAWGRGIEKISTACKEAGMPEPFYRIRPNEVMIDFNTVAQSAEKLLREQVGVQVREQVEEGVSPEAIKLLLTMQGEMPQSAILESLGLKSRNNLSKRYIKPALDAGLIEMTIPGTPNSRLQKYRLTDRGHSMVVSIKTRKQRPPAYIRRRPHFRYRAPDLGGVTFYV